MYPESDPGWAGYPTLKRLHGKIWSRLPALAGHPTYHVNVTSGLPHLPGVLHFHVNRPLDASFRKIVIYFMLSDLRSERYLSSRYLLKMLLRTCSLRFAFLISLKFLWLDCLLFHLSILVLFAAWVVIAVTNILGSFVCRVPAMFFARHATLNGWWNSHETVTCGQNEEQLVFFYGKSIMIFEG